jgi:insertion element IS1 protein InsB
MATIKVHCPVCNSDKVVKYGYLKNGEQRFRCDDDNCSMKTFVLNYRVNGRKPGIMTRIIDMTLNASGIRDISRVLGISPNTVIKRIKEENKNLSQVNIAYLQAIQSDKNQEFDVDIICVNEAEGDEMWSFVGSKKRQHWIWHAIDHKSGKVLAYAFGDRKDDVCKELAQRLKPFGIIKFYTDGWGAYARIPVAKQHIVGKKNTQKIERKHLTWRTRIKRLARKTICFSKSILMHDTVVGLFINRFEFAVP